MKGALLYKIETKEKRINIGAGNKTSLLELGKDYLHDDDVPSYRLSLHYKP